MPPDPRPTEDGRLTILGTFALKLDIQAFVPGPFQAHGQIEMWREGSIIRLRAQGPFNREAVLGLARAMADLLRADPPPAEASGAPGRFGDLLEISGSMITSPDTMAEMERFLGHMAALGQAPVAIAYVAAPEVEGRDIMLPLIEAMYQRQGRRFGAFETLAEARVWMQEQLDLVPETDSR